MDNIWSSSPSTLTVMQLRESVPPISVTSLFYQRRIYFSPNRRFLQNFALGEWMNAVETDSDSRQSNLTLYMLSVVFVLFATCFKATYQAVVRWVDYFDSKCLIWFNLICLVLTWFVLTWLDLSWLVLTWLVLSWLVLTWLDLTWGRHINFTIEGNYLNNEEYDWGRGKF